MCDVCQREELPDQIRDCTQDAKDILERLTGMNAVKLKVKVCELVMTYMGSKAKDIINNNFHMVKHYGKGKTSFKNSSVAAQFMQYLICEGFLKENLWNVEDKVSVTYVTHGNVANLVGNMCKVFFSTNLK